MRNRHRDHDMTIDAILPTPELLRRYDKIRYQPPLIDQTTKRTATKLKCPFEALYDEKKLDDFELAAGLKLARHYRGALGKSSGVSKYGESLDRSVDNSDDGDEGTWTPAEKKYYHGQKMEQAEAGLDHRRAWAAMVGLLDGQRTLEDVGRDWFGCKSKQQAYIAGVALVREGLRALGKYWKLLDRPPNDY